MEFLYVDDAAGLDALRSELEGSGRVALDCEAAGYHRYSDRLCLVQVTTQGHTYLLDPFAVDPEEVLRPALLDPSVEVLMHGADFDIRLLDRDLGIGVAGLFDTQIAASLLGERALGLSSLLESRLGIRLSKKYQKADWAKRPLPEPMRAYAARDTAHLAALAEDLREELDARGRLTWAMEEFREMEKVRFEEINGRDPIQAIREARDLDPRAVDRLRAALAWRDRIGLDLDRAVFRVVGDSVLVEAARSDPPTIEALGGLRGMGSAVLDRWGEDLLARFAEIDRLPDDQVVGYPPRARSSNGAGGRPTPEVEERLARLKAVRNRRAVALKVDRGTLLSNSILQLIAESPPSDPTELESMRGIRRWQAELLGDELVAAL